MVHHNPGGLSDIKLTTFLLYAGATILAIKLTSLILSTISAKAKAAKYAKMAQQRRTERDNKLKNITFPQINISETLKEKILNSDATTLLQMLKSNEVTSEQILVTYMQRAATIGKDLNLLADVNYEDALAEARRCDKLRKENPSACKGELFGLPMSVKDCFRLKGTVVTGGMACRANDVDSEDGLLLKVLKGEGAIPFIKSNIPQVMMSNETSNYIWGQAKNPWNQGRTVGGSSGGEGGLLASRCSPLGIGNDIGGSIRIPAMCCGVVGLKPTAERISTAGTMKTVPMLDNLLNLKVATGPLTKSVRDVNLLMKALLNGAAHKTAELRERDAFYIRKQWEEEVALSKPKQLRIGYYKSVDFSPTSLANQRAVEEAVQALKKQGHQLVEVELPNAEELILVFFEIVSAEGDAQFLKDGTLGEKTIPDYDRAIVAAQLPNCLRGIMKVLLTAVGEERNGKIARVAGKKSAYEFLCMVERQKELKDKFFRFWQDQKLDALLSPGFTYPAQKLGDAKDLLIGACYTFIFNVLNLPTGAVPVTLVKEGEDVFPKNMTKYHDLGFKKMNETLKGSVGMPVSVQLSTLPFEEEKCVAIMAQLEESIQFVKNHPYPM